VERLYRDIRRLALVFGDHYDTVFSRAKRFGKLEFVQLGMLFSIGSKDLVHDMAAELRRALCAG
jgi:hypothetical protein